MKYPYRCKKCNSISTVDKPIKSKAKFEYCEHCESDEPLVMIEDSSKIRKFSHIDKYYFYNQGMPLRNNDMLCQKLAEKTNELTKYIRDMNKEELDRHIKPIFKNCNIDWKGIV